MERDWKWWSAKRPRTGGRDSPKRLSRAAGGGHNKHTSTKTRTKSNDQKVGKHSQKEPYHCDGGKHHTRRTHPRRYSQRVQDGRCRSRWHRQGRQRRWRQHPRPTQRHPHATPSATGGTAGDSGPDRWWRRQCHRAPRRAAAATTAGWPTADKSRSVETAPADAGGGKGVDIGGAANRRGRRRAPQRAAAGRRGMSPPARAAGCVCPHACAGKTGAARSPAATAAARPAADGWVSRRRGARRAAAAALRGWRERPPAAARPRRPRRACGCRPWSARGRPSRPPRAPDDGGGRDGPPRRGGGDAARAVGLPPGGGGAPVVPAACGSVRRPGAACGVGRARLLAKTKKDRENEHKRSATHGHGVHPAATGRRGTGAACRIFFLLRGWRQAAGGGGRRPARPRRPRRAARRAARVVPAPAGRRPCSVGPRAPSRCPAWADRVRVGCGGHRRSDRRRRRRAQRPRR